MPTDLDLRLHDLSRIICTSHDTQRIADAVAEHRRLCKESVDMPASFGKQRYSRAAILDVVLSAVRQLHADTGRPVRITAVAEQAGLTRLVAGQAVGQLAAADKVRTTRTNDSHQVVLVTPM